MAAMEYAKTEKEAFDAISEKIKKNRDAIIKMAFGEDITTRKAAEIISKERILKAMRYQGGI